MEVEPERFGELVEAALDSIPPELASIPAIKPGSRAAA